jgi:multiple sugar transport system substrate-binding protein
MGISRRDLLRTSAGLAIGAAGTRLLKGTPAFAQDEMTFKPEVGAELRVLRW